MKPNKTIEQYADEYAERKYPLEKLIDFEKITVLQVASQSSFLAGAAKQKELDAEKIKDYEQALKYFISRATNPYHKDGPIRSKKTLGMFQEVLKKWGAL